ncbi:DUF6255 family natural product biosynthesis protein [Streptomyces roseoverticillatus]|uniref:DUF6255 family natural product biosynthesis protein n=1 Tax=Streptomyces roseoverticillatus TaxID=66429 RepID=UPI0033CA0629
MGSTVRRTAIGDQRGTRRGAAEPGNASAPRARGLPDMPGAKGGLVGGGERRGQGESRGRARRGAAALEVAHDGGDVRVRIRCNRSEGWNHPAPGEARCRSCGVTRFADYGAVRPPGLAHALTPKPGDARKADRSAATWIANVPRKRVWWGLTPVA